MATYHFITKQNDQQFTPPQQLQSFIQIALFPHPKTKLYHVRKFKIDEGGNVIKMMEYNIIKGQYEKLIKQKKPNEYKQYSVYSLKNIEYPSRGDILLLKSNILSTNSSYSGYASFDPLT